MTQNVPLNDGDPAVEGFFDAIQEMLSGTSENLEFDLSNSTTVVVRAGTGDKQVSVSIGGQYRWITTDKTRAHPGGSAGIYDLSVTSADNATGIGTPAGGDSSFDLAITATGAAPTGVARYRVVRRLVWDGTKITGVFRLPNEPHGELPIGSLGLTMSSGDPSPYWLIADGRGGSGANLSATAYPRLAAILGSTGGWITLPDWRGYTLAGAINGGTPAGAAPNTNSRLQLVLGASAGTVLHLLASGELPKHFHQLLGVDAFAPQSGGPLRLPYFQTQWQGDWVIGPNTGDGAVAVADDGQARGGSHENRQPTKAANVMIRVL